MTKAGSQSVTADVAVRQRCSVDDCSGCVVPAVQRACFSAQQCAVAKCIGTVVNMERPMCSAGRLLQAGLDVDLAKMHGIWTVMTDLVSFVLRAASGVQQDSMQLEFIDEIFFSLVCEAKNGIIASMAILTSLINGMVNSADRAKRESKNLDQSQDQEAANEEAVRTMTAAATTNFLSQISISVLYVPIVMKKTLMCHTDAFLSVFDVTGFKLELSSSKYATATNGLVGRCLSEYHKESMQQSDSSQSQQGFASIIQDLAVDAGSAIGQIPFEIVIHTLDGAFSYMVGIVSGLQDLVATADQKNCNLPDTEADEIATCACGDTPAMIPPVRGNEGVAEGAFWCSGMLSLISSMGESYIGYNPYTYSEIIAALGGQDAYLRCISSSTSCAADQPTLPDLASQGISLFTVATRCKSNYANSQWDEGAAKMFSDGVSSKFIVRAHGLAEKVAKVRADAEQRLPPSLVACMRLSLQENVGNDMCLQDFLTTRNARRQGFFEYMAIKNVDGPLGSQHIAACEVFTGPASGATATGVPFRKCLDEYDDIGCTLPGMVWAGRSTNRVPAATAHARIESDPGKRMLMARNAFREIRENVNLILKGDVSKWDAAHLDLAIFTAEGDALHQLFDALVAGPYARANMWPADVAQELALVDWYRDTKGGTTREFQLPCSGDALRGVTTAPFTCGSATRRAVIRYFMKDVFAADSDDKLKASVKTAVEEMVTKLIGEWNIDSYGCLCTSNTVGITDSDVGKHAPECCDARDPESFLPASLQSSRYTTLDGNVLVDGIFETVGDFFGARSVVACWQTVLQVQSRPHRRPRVGQGTQDLGGRHRPLPYRHSATRV